MALNYIQPFHVAGMAVYRCSCGETVIMQTKKVTSGERTQCSKCSNTPERKPRGKYNKYRAQAQYGCVTLTGEHKYTPRTHGFPYKYYQGKCTCGHVAYYTRSTLCTMTDKCPHMHHHGRPLTAGFQLGIYSVISNTGRKQKTCNIYRFRCTACGYEFEARKADIRNPQKCYCHVRRRNHLKKQQNNNQ